MLTDLSLKKWRPTDTTTAKRDITNKVPATGNLAPWLDMSNAPVRGKCNNE